MNEQLFSHFYFYGDLLGTAVFAVSGALAAAEKRMDILAFCLFGVLTAIGGGTARDLILNRDAVFWVADDIHLHIALASAVMTYFFAHSLSSISKPLVWMDAVGLSIFCVQGSAVALTLGASPTVAVVMGMMTATFGSIIRDTILDRPAVLLGPEIYVSAALVGSTTYVIMAEYDAINTLALLTGTAAAFTLRAAAIIFGLQLPKFKGISGYKRGR
ncbi:hypothetical protein SIN8267_00682 [Sinobacterium norvegicum]|uniref:Glycine transporter domain-containing protein n=1 Tax=Sinobacterium norvegicum TaxID=1641715 RepID=A0ABM9ABK8_9GAMM|nr:trimeric intracellular cation channel family protein [Sinobacterium norvegicum]CAH0990588.1 hypothetical protein SIN8267_00682 [Sinobacterium norvegicum]